MSSRQRRLVDAMRNKVSSKSVGVLLNLLWYNRRPCFIRNTRDNWAEIEARLKKPSYDELKKKKSGSDGGTAAGGHHFVKDLEGDGGIGAFSKLHHEMEQAILQGEDKL